MSDTTKTVIGIAVLVALAAGGYLYWSYVVVPGSTPNAEEVTTLPSGSDTSDNAIDQDVAAIDAQLEGVEGDSANVSASIDEVSQQ